MRIWALGIFPRGLNLFLFPDEGIASILYPKGFRVFFPNFRREDAGAGAKPPSLWPQHLIGYAWPASDQLSLAGC